MIYSEDTSHGLTSKVATASIVVNHSPLREHSLGGGEREVKVKDGAEYGISIKNHLHTRLVVDIWIDGEKITTDSLYIPGYQVTHLERYFDTPRKFKFVKYDGSGREGSVAPADAGKVHIEIKYNKPQWVYVRTEPIVKRWNGFIGDAQVSYSSCFHSAVLEPKNLGTTVEGSESKQEFKEIRDDTPTDAMEVINFRLVVADEPKKITPTIDEVLQQINGGSVSFCSNCGKKVRFGSAKFCSYCGHRL